MNIGIRAHDLGCDTAENLAKIGARFGVQSIQLAPGKALSPSLSPSHYSADIAKQVARSFHKQGIEIAVLGCYINPVHPDVETRQLELRRFRESLKFARDFGAHIVGTETGSLLSDCSFHPDNHSATSFEQLLDVLWELAEEAKRNDVTIGLEVAREHVIHDFECMRSALDTLNHTSVQVIFDPVNVMTSKELENQSDFFEKSFRLIGKDICACHAKDIVKNGESLKRVAPGQGNINYQLYFSYLNQYKPDAATLIEEIQKPFIEGSIHYLKDFKN